MYCPTRIDDTMLMANGKLKKRNAATVNVMTCASNSVVPTKPANIVVISKLHASAVIDNAPLHAILINGYNTSLDRYSFDSKVLSTANGHVDCSELFL